MATDPAPGLRASVLQAEQCPRRRRRSQLTIPTTRDRAAPVSLSIHARAVRADASRTSAPKASTRDSSSNTRARDGRTGHRLAVAAGADSCVTGPQRAGADRPAHTPAIAHGQGPL